MAEAKKQDENIEAVATEEVAAEEPKLAKAGKRSAKAVAEAEEKQAKEERKEVAAEEAEKPKQHANPTRSRLDRRGKKYREAAKAIDADKVYDLKEGLEAVVKASTVKFDATVEVHVNLGVDPRHADQNIRDMVVLPAGTGKDVRVAVFADDEVAGADVSGVDAIIKNLEKGTIDFDILVSTPANMPKLGKYARLLGPRGLMPNPKSGTVTTDLAKAVKEAKAGRVEYRVDGTGIVHVGVGKVSFKPADLEANVRALFVSLRGNKPASVKGNYVKAVHLATAMGPSVTVNVSEI
jgi:large subunit ribosomal protein L1